MFWQFIVVLAASLGFPTAALLFLIGGPRFPDEQRGPESRGTAARGTGASRMS
ncbi:hypothetical protein AB0E96_00945 [Kitasatospora sp. NPDC036755]|uniref:hypothetical protein n=1 Tax=Kitasatospora sp. NPDC036755 TaxID=3154600 RepID=UPI0033E6FF71